MTLAHEFWEETVQPQRESMNDKAMGNLDQEAHP